MDGHPRGIFNVGPAVQRKNPAKKVVFAEGGEQYRPYKKEKKRDGNKKAQS